MLRFDCLSHLPNLSAKPHYVKSVAIKFKFSLALSVLNHKRLSLLSFATAFSVTKTLAAAFLFGRP
jgi:hypothetical protein